MPLRAIVAAAVLASAPATAFEQRTPAFVPAHNCTCRFRGEEVGLGTRRCLETPEGPRLAECVTEQNVTSWRPSRNECPQALLLTPRR